MANFDPEPRRRRQNMGPYQLLSLFLLLLAFFILLNAIATIQESKARVALSSLAATFRTVVEPETSAEIYVSTLGPRPRPEEVLQELERLWITAIAVAKVKILTPGQTMEMTMPINEVFMGGEAALRTDRRMLFQNVARTLARRPEGFVNHLELVINMPGAFAETAKRSETLEMSQAAAFAEVLKSYGAPVDSLAVGVQESERSLLRLRFSVLEAGRARLTFDLLAPAPAQ